MSNKFSYQAYFPYPEIRDAQSKSIDFILDSFLNKDKKFVIVEAGTGVGKSAVGYTVAKYLNSLPENKDSKFNRGGYFLTTQKILQEQYIKILQY